MRSKADLPEYCRPTRVSSISTKNMKKIKLLIRKVVHLIWCRSSPSFQNNDLNQSRILLIIANILFDYQQSFKLLLKINFDTIDDQVEKNFIRIFDVGDSNNNNLTEQLTESRIIESNLY